MRLIKRDINLYTVQLPSISVHKITSIRSVTQLAGPKTAVAKSESGEEPWQTTWMPDPIWSLWSLFPSWVPPVALLFFLPVVLDSSLHTYGRSHRSSKRSPETFCNAHQQHGLVTLLFVCGREDPQWLVQKPRAEPPFASGHLYRHMRFGSFWLIGSCDDVNGIRRWRCCIIDVVIIVIKKTVANPGWQSDQRSATSAVDTCTIYGVLDVVNWGNNIIVIMAVGIFYQWW